MAAVKQMKNEEEKAFEVNEWVFKVQDSDRKKDRKGIIKEFVDKYGGHKEFIGYVGSYSVSLAQEHKNKLFPPSKLATEDFAALLKGERKETGYSVSLIELTSALKERSDDLRKKANELGRTVEEKKAGKSFDEVFNNIAGKNPLKANDDMILIGEGAFSLEEIKNMMDKLLREYERVMPGGKKEVVLGERIRTFNAVLASEYRDMTYEYNCATSRQSA